MGTHSVVGLEGDVGKVGGGKQSASGILFFSGNHESPTAYTKLGVLPRSCGVVAEHRILFASAYRYLAHLLAEPMAEMLHSDHGILKN